MFKPLAETGVPQLFIDRALQVVSKPSDEGDNLASRGIWKLLENHTPESLNQALVFLRNPAVAQLPDSSVVDAAMAIEDHRLSMIPADQHRQWLEDKASSSLYGVALVIHKLASKRISEADANLPQLADHLGELKKLRFEEIYHLMLKGFESLGSSERQSKDALIRAFLTQLHPGSPQVDASGEDHLLNLLSEWRDSPAAPSGRNRMIALIDIFVRSGDDPVEVWASHANGERVTAFLMTLPHEESRVFQLLSSLSKRGYTWAILEPLKVSHSLLLSVVENGLIPDQAVDVISVLQNTKSIDEISEETAETAKRVFLTSFDNVLQTVCLQDAKPDSCARLEEILDESPFTQACALSFYSADEFRVIMGTEFPIKDFSEIPILTNLMRIIMLMEKSRVKTIRREIAGKSVHAKLTLRELLEMLPEHLVCFRELQSGRVSNVCGDNITTGWQGSRSRHISELSSDTRFSLILGYLESLPSKARAELLSRSGLSIDMLASSDDDNAAALVLGLGPDIGMNSRRYRQISTAFRGDYSSILVHAARLVQEGYTSCESNEAVCDHARKIVLRNMFTAIAFIKLVDHKAFGQFLQVETAQSDYDTFKGLVLQEQLRSIWERSSSGHGIDSLNLIRMSIAGN